MPQQTISITNSVSGNLTNAYSVTLSSSDSTYGIKNITTNQVVVPDNTSTLNPDTGVYAYVFSADYSSTYEVSWQIVQTHGAEPSYQVETITPFPLGSNQITAIPDQIGTFIQGQNGTTLLDITDWQGNAIDPTSITVSITDPFGVVLVLPTNLPQKIRTGYYSYEWTIDLKAPVGSYLITWYYTLQGSSTTNTVYQSIVVAASPPIVAGAQPTIYNDGILSDLIKALGFYLCCCQKIPVYYEQAKPSIDNQNFTFSFTGWNQTPAIKVYRNDIIVNNQVIVDYFNGVVTFNQPLTQYDKVNVDYTFRWFTDEQLANYLNNALKIWNVTPPYSNWTFTALNPNITAALEYKAAADAIREMIMCLMFQENQKVFGGPEEAAKVRGDLETLKKNYEADWNKIYDNKKNGPYPVIGIGVAMSYSLPGGRSRYFRQLFTGAPNM